ncbi:MAG: ATPase, partial [Flavisolibacter sp.]
ESAYEILNEKISVAQKKGEEKKEMELEEKEDRRSSKKEKSILDNPIIRSAGRTAATMITRSLLGVLGLGGSSRRRKGSLF